MGGGDHVRWKKGIVLGGSVRWDQRLVRSIINNSWFTTYISLLLLDV